MTTMDRPLLALKGHEGIVRSAAFSPDGRSIVTGGDDRSARLYDAESGKEIASFSPISGVGDTVARMDVYRW